MEIFVFFERHALLTFENLINAESKKQRQCILCNQCDTKNQNFREKR